MPHRHNDGRVVFLLVRGEAALGGLVAMTAASTASGELALEALVVDGINERIVAGVTHGQPVCTEPDYVYVLVLVNLWENFPENVV